MGLTDTVCYLNDSFNVAEVNEEQNIFNLNEIIGGL
jgi:hypothetical protein